MRSSEKRSPQLWEAQPLEYNQDSKFRLGIHSKLCTTLANKDFEDNEFEIFIILVRYMTKPSIYYLTSAFCYSHQSFCCCYSWILNSRNKHNFWLIFSFDKLTFSINFWIHSVIHHLFKLADLQSIKGTSFNKCWITEWIFIFP